MSDSDQGWVKVVSKSKSKPKTNNVNQVNMVNDNSKTSYPHQNWDQITLRSRSKQTGKVITKTSTNTITKLKYNAGKNVQNKMPVNANKIEQQVDNEEQLAVPTISYNFQLQLRQARQQKGWTQKQLANECQLPENTIKNYENGTIIPNYQDIQKMSKSLDIILKNK